MSLASITRMIAANTGLSRKTVSMVLADFRDLLKIELDCDGKLRWDGVGTFVLIKQVRRAKDPLTGSAGEHPYIHFRPSTILSAEVKKAWRDGKKAVRARKTNPPPVNFHRRSR